MAICVARFKTSNPVAFQGAAECGGLYKGQIRTIDLDLPPIGGVAFVFLKGNKPAEVGYATAIRKSLITTASDWEVIRELN